MLERSCVHRVCRSSVMLVRTRSRNRRVSQNLVGIAVLERDVQVVNASPRARIPNELTRNNFSARRDAIGESLQVLIERLVGSALDGQAVPVMARVRAILLMTAFHAKLGTNLSVEDRVYRCPRRNDYVRSMLALPVVGLVRICGVLPGSLPGGATFAVDILPVAMRIPHAFDVGVRAGSGVEYLVGRDLAGRCLRSNRRLRITLRRRSSLLA